MTMGVASGESADQRVERSASRAGRLGVVAWVAYVVLAIVVLVSTATQANLTIGDAAFMAAFLVFASVGAVLVWRQPRNAVGWTLLVVALAAVIQGGIGAYAAAVAKGQDLPGATFAAWVDSWIWGVSVGAAVVVLPLVFPDGRPLPDRRIRRFARAMVGLFALGPLFYMFAPGPFPAVPSISNPLGIALLEPIEEVGRTLFPLLGVIPIAACAAIPAVRYRRAGPDERRQIKWFAFAAIVLAVVLIVNLLLDDALEVVLAVCISFVPLAIGFAVLRYRLYDIDLIINRTLVWVPLTAVLGGLYAASVALLQRVFVNLTGDRSDAAIVISTLILAGLFTPARRTLDTIVDRRFRVEGRTRASEPGADVPQDGAELDQRIETISRRVAIDVVGVQGETGAGGRSG